MNKLPDYLTDSLMCRECLFTTKVIPEKCRYPYGQPAIVLLSMKHDPTCSHNSENETEKEFEFSR